MAITMRKKLILLVFCLGSVIQGMCSTYFVSILTTIERLYQIQSKTAGAIMSATEVGQILGSLIIAYYGGKGNKPRWLAVCMCLTALAALLSTSPYFLFNQRSQPPSAALLERQADEHMSAKPASLLRAPIPAQLCHLGDRPPMFADATRQLSPAQPTPVHSAPQPTAPQPEASQEFAYSSQKIALVIFSLSLLVIGLSCTSIVTIGFPLVDDYVSKRESPLVFGLTIALKVFGPALGFLLGSLCMRYDVNLFSASHPHTSSLSSLANLTSLSARQLQLDPQNPAVGAWWLGPILISMPLFVLASLMYLLSHLSSSGDDQDDNDDRGAHNDLEDITYQAAEDHSLGGSSEFRPNVLSAEILDITSNRTSYSDEASSSKEVLQPKNSKLKFHSNFKSNISLGRPIITRENLISESKIINQNQSWKTNCVLVNHYGHSKSTSLSKDEEEEHMNSPYIASSSSSLSLKSSDRSTLTLDLYSSLLRLMNNRLLILRTLSGVLHILPIAGFYTFFPKYLIEQFRVAPPNASAISGLFGILFVGIGTLLGGTIVRVLNVNSKFMTRWIAASALFYSIGMLVLMNLGCTNNQIIYSENKALGPENCVQFCRCTDEVFNPVCANGTTFMAPCLAGCRGYSISSDKITYQDCGCSKENKVQATWIDSPQASTATDGHCSISCDSFIWYIMIFCICTIIHSSSEVGGMMFNLRCVDKEDRTLALGLITFSQSLLGTIPCSILYGTLIDFTCIYWDKISYPSDDTEVSVRGACRAYQNDKFHYYLHGMTALVMFVAFIIDSIVSRNSNKVNFYTESESNSNVTIDLKESSDAI